MKTVKIRDLATTIRCKNAKGFRLTFDIIFPDKETYEKVKKAHVISRELVAKLYNTPIENVVALVYYDAGCAIKATIVRPIPSGNIGDTDVFGMQQHAPLYDIEVPWN